MEKYDFIKEEDKVIIINNEAIKALNEDSYYLTSGNYKILYDDEINQEIKFVIKENDEVNIDEIHLYNCSFFGNYYLGKTSKVNLNCYYYSNIENASAHIYLLENAYININSIYLLKGKNELTQDIYLDKGCKLNFNGASINNSSLEQTINVNVYHNKENSETNMLFYGICLNDSILNINTDGIIKKGAINSVLHQTTKGLIISSKSMISANPFLHIDDNDVIASHGASIGTIDDEEMFYLMSRGLTKEESEELIIKGFLEPIIRFLDDNSLKIQISNELNKE